MDGCEKCLILPMVLADLQLLISITFDKIVKGIKDQMKGCLGHNKAINEVYTEHYIISLNLWLMFKSNHKAD